MNVIKNLSLRHKLIIIFAFLTLITIGALYVFRLFLVVELFGAATPTLEFSEVALLNSQVQKEALEYVATGEEETVVQFHENADQLNTLVSELTLEDNEYAEILVSGRATVLSLIETGEGIIQTHGQTLELLETLDGLEGEKEAALEAINREELIGNADLRSEMLLLNQMVVLGERLHTQTVEFVLTGEGSALDDVEASRARLVETIDVLQAQLTEKGLIEPLNLQSALDTHVEIESLSAQIVANHIQTADQLAVLEDLENQVEATRDELNLVVEEAVVTLFNDTDNLLYGGGIVFLLFYIGVALLIARIFVRPTASLGEAAEKMGQGDYSVRLPVSSNDEIGQLMQSFNTMAEQMQQTVAELYQHSQALETSSEVSHRLSTILNVEELTTAVVELLKVQFNYYHAHIYLFDDAREYLVMAGGTGVAGEALLASGHKIEVGKGLVGRAAAHNEPILVPDVSLDQNWLPNPLLPDTAAEVAVPITLEGRVLGVLDVQNRKAGTLTTEDVEMLQSVAWQVAIGLKNAHLYEDVQQEKMQVQTILDSLSLPIIISRLSDGQVTYVNDAFSEAAMLSREMVIGQATPDFYANPADRYAILTGLQTEGSVTDFETVLKRGNDEHFWTLLSASIVAYGGEPSILASVLDIDSRKQAEALLAKNASELEIVSQVSTVAATILEPQEMLQRVADLTKSSFDLYHAHIHLLDESGQTLVLTAGAGEVGREMVAEGRRIPLAAEGSLVASVARNGKGATRNYETAGEGFMPHPLLQDTRSEMAVPMAVGGNVLGVLDVRSDKLNYFTELDMQTVTSLASQVAVALQNARSYARSEEALKELQELSRRLTREGWNEYLSAQHDQLTYTYELQDGKPQTNGNGAGTAVPNEDDSVLMQPLQIQGESFGQLAFTGLSPQDMEKAEIIAAVAERLSAHLENLRLAEQTQVALSQTERRTEELAVLNEMSQTLTAQSTVDGVLQTVYDYLSRLMDTTHFFSVLYDEEMDEVEFALTADEKELKWHTEKRQAGHGITEYIIKHRQPLLMSENVGGRLAELGVTDYDKLPESWLGVPVTLGNRVLGVIGLESYTTPHLFTEEHLNLLTAIANQAAISIESTRLLQGTVALAEEEQILRQITARVSTAVDAESILRTAAEEIGRALGLEGDIVLEGIGADHAAKQVNGHNR